MNALMYALPSLGAIGLGVALVSLFGRDPQGADEHDVADYHETPEMAELRQRFLTAAKHGRPVILPPTTPVRSVFAETAAAMGIWPADAGAIVAVVASRYGDSPADRAARMLREIAAEQRGLAVA